MRSAFKTKLLCGGAVIALLATVDGTQAQAQGQPPGSWSFFFEGGYAIGSNSTNNTTYADIGNGAGGSTGTNFKVDAGNGFVGRAGATWQFTDRWSGRFAYTGLRANGRGDTGAFASSVVYTVLGKGTSYVARGIVSTHTTVDMADLQIGYDVGLGSIGVGGDIQATLLGGLRYGDFSQRINGIFPFVGGAGLQTDLRNGTFRGAGPTLGATASLPIGSGFAVEGTVLGGALIGRLSSNTLEGGEQVGAVSKNGVAGTFDGQLALTYTLPTAPSVQLAAGYQAFYEVGVRDSSGIDLSVTPHTSFGSTRDDLLFHGPFARLKVTFGAAPPPPPPVAAAPPPPPPPAAAPPPPPKQFVVYFEFDKSDLTPEGAKVVLDAANAYKQTGSARIAVTGYTDLSGTQRYNLGLSKRRADTVHAALVRDGVPDGVIAEAWRGKENPAVPTPDGVREPRNRRVEIVE